MKTIEEYAVHLPFLYSYRKKLYVEIIKGYGLAFVLD